MSEWIEHAKEQPLDGQAVLYYFDITGISIGNYDVAADCYHGDRGYLCGDVTHWMPLPDPPEVQGE